MLGTDTLKYSAAKVVGDPFTGSKVCLLPALILDVALIHVHRADCYGNAQIEGITGFGAEMARATKRVILSAEEIVPTDEIRKYPTAPSSLLPGGRRGTPPTPRTLARWHVHGNDEESAR
jgi:acyl CoA:acetate/3-ketoacid CoA transferase alpha subunit